MPEWKIHGWSRYGWGNTLEGDLALKKGDFSIRARLTLSDLDGGGASFIMGGGYHTPFAVPEGRHALRIWLYGADGKMYLMDYPTRRGESARRMRGLSATTEGRASAAPTGSRCRPGG